MNRRFFCSFRQHFIFFLKGRRSEGAQERERADVIESKDVLLTEGKKGGPPLQPPYH